jgi:hypothetical protein
MLPVQRDTYLNLTKENKMDLLVGVALAAQIEKVDEYPHITPYLEFAYNNAALGVNYEDTKDVSYYGSYSIGMKNVNLYGVVTYDDDKEEFIPSVKFGYAIGDNTEAFAKTNLKDFDHNDLMDNIYVGLELKDSIFSY